MKKKTFSIFMIVLLTSSISLSFIPKIARAQEHIIWSSTTSLPSIRAQHASVAHNGRIYVLGGWAFAGDNTVEYCDVNPDGTIDAWFSTTSLPERRSESVAIAHNNFLYVLGGQGGGSILERDTVFFASINPGDGSLSSWNPTTALPYRSSGHGAFVWSDRIYIVGGWTGGSFQRSTYFSEINADGTIGSWVATTLLPEGRGHGVAAIAHNGYAYVLGGQGSPGTPNDDKSDVWYAKINTDGHLGSWTSATSMPFGLETHGVAVVNNEVYVIGGVNQVMSPPQRAEVHRAPINSDGSLGMWTPDTDLALPTGIEHRGHLIQTPVCNNRIYVIGGTDDTGTSRDTVYLSQELVGIDWIPTTQLPTPSANHHSVVHKDEIYIVGGNSPTSGVNYDRVLHASTQSYGHITLDGWRSTTPLPLDDTGQSERTNSPVVTFNNWIYVLDGSAERPPNRIERDTVCYAPINADGTIGAWTWTTRMPYAGCQEAVQWNGKIYIIAGWDGYNEHNEVHFAEIDAATGQLGPWMSTTSLPQQLAHGHATTVHNGRIYVLGGHEAIPSDVWLNKVWFASIDEVSGEVSSWTETTSLPVTLDAHEVEVYGDEIFVIGGYIHGVGLSDVVYKALIYPDGSLSSWEEYCYLPEPLRGFGSGICNDRIYIIGGVSETSGITDKVYFINLMAESEIPVLPRLYTEGRFIKNEVGEIVHLYGVNKPGLEWSWGDFDGDGNKEARMYNENDNSEYHDLGWVVNGQAEVNEDDWSLIRSWGCNVVRIGFQQKWWEESENYRQIIDKSIETSEKFGMYTILDNHWTNDIKKQDTGYPEDWASWKDMWTNIAERYVSKTSILFDIWNEPHSISDIEWRTEAQDCVNRIRSTGNEAIILISSTDWGHGGIWWAVWDPITGGNIAYTLHWYQELTPGPSSELGIKMWLFVLGWWNIKNVAPVITGEFNVADELAALGSQEEWMRNFCSVMDDWDIHFLSWGWYPEEWKNPAPWEFALLKADGVSWNTPSKGGEITIEEIAKAKANDGIGGSHSITSMLTVTAHSPVNIIVTISSGDRIGYDSITGQIINEITDAAYFGPETEPQIIAIPIPQPGVYIIDRYGIDTGSYTITIESFSDDNSLIDTETWSGIASQGELERGSIQMFEDGSFVDAPHSVIPEIPWGTIMASAAMIVALVAYITVPKWRRKRFI